MRDYTPPNDVRDYGAVIDGHHDDTGAFIQAFESTPHEEPKTEEKVGE